MERAYIYGHAAIECPNCGRFLLRMQPPEDHREPNVIVVCTNPACTELGKHKTYARPSVELTDAYPTQKPA